MVSYPQVDIPTKATSDACMATKGIIDTELVTKFQKIFQASDLLDQSVSGLSGSFATLEAAESLLQAASVSLNTIKTVATVIGKLGGPLKAVGFAAKTFAEGIKTGVDSGHTLLHKVNANGGNIKRVIERVIDTNNHMLALVDAAEMTFGTYGIDMLLVADRYCSSFADQVCTDALNDDLSAIGRALGAIDDTFSLDAYSDITERLRKLRSLAGSIDLGRLGALGMAPLANLLTPIRDALYAEHTIHLMWFKVTFRMIASSTTGSSSLCRKSWTPFSTRSSWQSKLS